MTIVTSIWLDQSPVGKGVACQIVREPDGGTFERHLVLTLRYAIENIAEVRDGIMTDVVLATRCGAVSTEIAYTGQALDIGFPGFAARDQLANDIVTGIRKGTVGAAAAIGVAAIVVGADDSPHQIFVVAYAGMGRRVIPSCKAALWFQAAEEGHAGVVGTTNIRVVGVFIHDQDYVSDWGHSALRHHACGVGNHE